MKAPSRRQMSGEPQLDQAVQRWLDWDQNPWTRAQVQSLVAAGRQDDLRKRLCCRMSFGTAGLRAPMGAGFSRINDLTVIQSTQGLHSYLSRCFPDLRDRGVVIGFDSRGQEESGCSSQRLAKLTAAVMLSREVPVHLFSTFVPTPYVPYAVQKLGAVAGVMITASHNPKEDNGYKVYWCNGAQICSPHDREILCCVEEQLEPWSSSCWEEELVETSSLRTDPLADISRSYMEELTSLCFHRNLNRRCPLKFVHSSFHGVGHDYVQKAFQTFGFAPPIPVPEQKDPDPNFSSVICPNPEEGLSVLVGHRLVCQDLNLWVSLCFSDFDHSFVLQELSVLLAEKENAPIVLATDPDADRLAVAEKSEGCGWKVFTGNELAALLGWWMFSNWKDAHPDPEDVQKVYMLSTTVSSKILQTFAREKGFKFEETLPGFKWIGHRIHELAQAGNTVLFSFEESIGFLCGSWVLDKDGISSAAVVAEMASYLYHKHLNLNQQLHIIYQTYGYHLSKTSYVVCEDPPTINSIFSRIRNFGGTGSYPKTCSGIQIVHVRDVTTGYDSSQPDLRSVLPVMKSSHMITFTLQNGFVATLRTSGTEPKIKCYAEYCAAPGNSDVSRLEEELQSFMAALLDEFLEPERNNLTRRHI